MPIKGEMYPSTDYPHYREIFETIDDLIEHVDHLDEGLNHIVSWIDCCRDCAEVEGQPLLFDKGEQDSFVLCIFMPRLTRFTEFSVKFPLGSEYPHAQIDNWLMDFVKPRVDRWYGW